MRTVNLVLLVLLVVEFLSKMLEWSGEDVLLVSIPLRLFGLLEFAVLTRPSVMEVSL